MVPGAAMEAGKMASPKSAPKDAQVMAQILKDTGIIEYEPRVINQMLEFAYRYVTTILEDAKIYSSHAKKSSVDADDVRLAIQCRTDQSFTSPPPRDIASRPILPDSSKLQAEISAEKGPPSAQAVSVSAKVGTPVSLTGQRFTVQIPTSQTSVKSGEGSPPTTPTVQNVLINPSLIGSKNILITTNMVSSQGAVGEVPNLLKRKHEEEEDYDVL
ncbi:hypothetical protein Chor_009703 [Crotalus horridus]